MLKSAVRKSAAERYSWRIRSHWLMLRHRLGLKTRLLDSQTMARVHASFVMPKRSQPGYQYELGHKFVLEHVVSRLKRTLSLDRRESGLVKAFLGRVYYNPPSRERMRTAVAAERLAALGERGEEIFSQLLEELLALRKPLSELQKLPSARAEYGDMFANPLAVRHMELSSREGFVDFATHLRKTAREEKWRRAG